MLELKALNKNVITTFTVIIVANSLAMYLGYISDSWLLMVAGGISLGIIIGKMMVLKKLRIELHDDYIDYGQGQELPLECIKSLKFVKIRNIKFYSIVLELNLTKDSQKDFCMKIPKIWVDDEPRFLQILENAGINLEK
ncbi:hypothetical protein [Francisella philomiragia]|uniref:hypothetical protein n=1 Tax=Francisella philomiragia TaxID=28110 RepID=UPI0019032C36|nr:hypothetical protein [Francisella philomiragia]MBK2268289.1 hypothetical protein [Francisella philomiragia]MBK2279716.1 hypothetical protein [Francisella philomiragia]MBK2287600.1 hypothetical protein [Francisella philomiragia]MBK2289579.1 hypothetical protein [Francisella philomiragia]MBK2291477.1 hypothetical protein [Francisella philomiragia]